MVKTGVIGGSFGYHALRFISRYVDWEGHCSGAAYDGKNKMEVLFGSDIWQRVAGKVVMDFGCGTGEQAIDIARHGAKKVVGIDVQDRYLNTAKIAADKAGVSQQCEFVKYPSEPVDVIISLDGFEHYADPAYILSTMRSMLKDNGRVLVSFGPTWCHPYGGHQFSVFPWAHLLFTEKALIRWRSDIASDGARYFHEVPGGLNRMTISQFEQLIADSEFKFDHFEAVPIRPARWLWSEWTREYFTSIVRCTLVPRLH